MNSTICLLPFLHILSPLSRGRLRSSPLLQCHWLHQLASGQHRRLKIFSHGTITPEHTTDNETTSTARSTGREEIAQPKQICWVSADRKTNGPHTSVSPVSLPCSCTRLCGPGTMRGISPKSSLGKAKLRQQASTLTSSTANFFSILFVVRFYLRL